MLVPPSFGLVRPAVIDVPPNGLRRPAVILVPPSGLARPGRAILVPPSGLALPVGAGAGAGASPSEVGVSSAAAFRRSRAAAAFGRVIVRAHCFYVLLPPRRRAVVGVAFAFAALRHSAYNAYGTAEAARRVVFSALPLHAGASCQTTARDVWRTCMHSVCGAFAPVTCVKCVYRPLARKYNAAPRAAAENQRSYSLQEHSKPVQQLLLSARTPQSEPRRSAYAELSACSRRARCFQPASNSSED